MKTTIATIDISTDIMDSLDIKSLSKLTDSQYSISSENGKVYLTIEVERGI